MYIKVGDRAMCLSANKGGLWTEYAVVSEDYCFSVPESMSYEDAAALPINYVTAYHMLFNFGGLRSGMSVLIQMAAGWFVSHCYFCFKLCFLYVDAYFGLEKK